MFSWPLGERGTQGPPGSEIKWEQLLDGTLFKGQSVTLKTEQDLLNLKFTMTFVAGYNLGQVYSADIIPASAMASSAEKPRVIQFPILIGEVTMIIQLSGPSFKTITAFETANGRPYALSKIYLTTMSKTKGQPGVSLAPSGGLSQKKDSLLLSPLKLLLEGGAHVDTTYELTLIIEKF